MNFFKDLPKFLRTLYFNNLAFFDTLLNKSINLSSTLLFSIFLVNISYKIISVKKSLVFPCLYVDHHQRSEHTGG